MLLHIGENRFVPGDSVVSILPADQLSEDNERLLKTCAQSGHYYPSYGRPKAYVICEKDRETFIYAASTAVRTLRERIAESRDEFLR